MVTPDLEILARFGATGLLNSLVEGAVIAVAAWTFLRFTGKQDSRTSFAVWFSALLLVVVLPWVGAPASSATSALGRFAASKVIPPTSWAVTIFWLWVAGATLALLRVGFAFWQLIRLRWHCRMLAMSELPPMLPVSVLNSFRGAKVCVSDEVRIPTAVGFVKPLIVIPSWALKELSPSELNSVLIHELEHVRCWDDWTNLAQKILAAVFFFHPAVWWMDRRLALEREMACDEAVLAQTDDRHAYAACLVRIAEKSVLRRGLALAQAIAGRMGQTTLRITQILCGAAQPTKGVWKPAFYLLGAVSLCGVLLLTQAPPLVGFQTESLGGSHAGSATGGAMLPATQDSVVLKPQAILARHSGQRTAVRMGQAMQPKVVYGKGVLSGRTPLIQSPNGVVQAVAVTEVTTVRTFLLVARCDQSGEFGPSFWTICFWHVDAAVRLPLNSEKRAPARII